MNQRLPFAVVLILLTFSAVGISPARDAAESPDALDPPTSPGRVSTALAEWEFESQQDLHAWQPNAHLDKLTIRDGALHARAIDWDPFLLCRGISFEARPQQYVIVRMRAGRGGIGELFWSGQLEGPYGGLTEAKKLRFGVAGAYQWQEIVLFPMWHTERAIRQLRLDLYENSDFEIDWIRIREWGRSEPSHGLPIWDLGGDTSAWQVHPSASELFAPAAELDVSGKTWVTVELASDRDGLAAVLWACEGAPGLQTEEFPVRGDGRSHIYNVPMADVRAWRGRIVAFGIRSPQDATIRPARIQIADGPSGPGELAVAYFGFENGVNRAGRPCRLLAQVINLGGGGQGIRQVHLRIPEGLRVLSDPDRLGHPGLEHGDVARFVWEIAAVRPGTYPVHLSFSGRGRLPSKQTATLTFTEAPAIPRAAYVPAPKPITTDVDVCAFYFPGWESDAKWDCIRKVAPGRKPLLGYYDESNPECVDWQIKWAVENGISCFLVDWYWVQGRQQLAHWFDAYRKARYRDLLKVAIMWANHNPPGTHSTEDWLQVTGHWIERYFSLPGYYQIDGKPAVFIWDPKAIRTDLGGSHAVREAFDKSQTLARQAGFGGITLVALGHDFSESHIQTLREEGYRAVTTYHEWGPGIDGQVARRLFSYEDVVRQSPEAWKSKNEAANGLMYYPLVDTGWDSRPWHGHKAMVIEGRTSPLFEALLRDARTFGRTNDKDLLILGPVNEWGEGSYIEPCTEFGFDMLEAIRRTFATEPAGDWPVNISPSDAGLGPYEFDAQQP